MSLDLVQNVSSYHGYRSAVRRQPCWLGFSGLPPHKKHKSCTERWRSVEGGGGGDEEESRMS